MEQQKQVSTGYTITVPPSYVKDYDKNREEVFDYRRDMATKQAICEDYDLENTITDDMERIWKEVGGQDGMYDNFPIKRVYRDGGIIRIYALDWSGGIAIIKQYNDYQILTLGEDDAYHFLNGRRIYETYHGVKQDFVHLLSEALSLLKHIKV